MDAIDQDTVYKTFSYRVKDASSGKHLARWARAVNVVWNFANEISIRSGDRGLKWVSKAQLLDLTKGSSKEIGLPSQVIQEIVDEFIDKRRANGKPKLRWRSRRSLGWMPFTNQDIVLEPGVAVLRGKRVRLWQHRPIEGRIKSGNFSQDAQGRWYCNLAFAVKRKLSNGTDEIGVDLGLKTLATCSDGTTLAQARFYRDLEPDLADAQRRRQKRRVKKLHAKIANRRKDALHKFSRALVNRCQRITVGDVSASKMAQTNMAKSVLDAGWSMLRGFLRYKCDHAGVAYSEVNEAYTTQACSCCGSIAGPRGKAGLPIRQWTCDGCGSEHDRDVNAARNIARIGCDTLSLA